MAKRKEEKPTVLPKGVCRDGEECADEQRTADAPRRSVPGERERERRSGSMPVFRAAYRLSARAGAQPHWSQARHLPLRVRARTPIQVSGISQWSLASSARGWSYDQPSFLSFFLLHFPAAYLLHPTYPDTAVPILRSGLKCRDYPLVYAPSHHRRSRAHC